MLLYWILGIFIVLGGAVGLLDLKLRKKFKKNRYLDETSNTLKPIPFRDPLLLQCKGLTRLLTGKLRGRDAIRSARDEFSTDVNGSTKLKLIQSAFFNFHFVVIWDADIARTVSFTKDTELTKGSFGATQQRMVGDSILQVTGDDWKHQKAALSPAFKWDTIRSALPHLIEVVNELSEILKEKSKEPVEIYPWIQKATLDAIGKGGFGFEFRAMREASERSEEIQNYENLTKEVANPIHFFEKLDKMKFIGRHNILDEYFTRFESFMANLIATNREAKEKEGANWEPKNILDYLIVSEDTEQLTDKQIARNLNTFFVAGHETTAGALANAVHFLAENPEIQKRAREEILSICGTNSPTFEDIQKMEFGHNCIKETLRLRPPAFGSVRLVERDQQVGNLFLAKGTMTLVHIYMMHHDPAYWGEDVDSFNPDRFTTENSKNRHRFAYMPFSIGPRQCIGNNFATLEMRSFLAVLLQKFEFATHPESKEPFGEYVGMVLCPPPNCTLIVKPIL